LEQAIANRRQPAKKQRGRFLGGTQAHLQERDAQRQLVGIGARGIDLERCGIETQRFPERPPCFIGLRFAQETGAAARRAFVRAQAVVGFRGRAFQDIGDALVRRARRIHWTARCTRLTDQLVPEAIALPGCREQSQPHASLECAAHSIGRPYEDPAQYLGCRTRREERQGFEDPAILAARRHEMFVEDRVRQTWEELRLRLRLQRPTAGLAAQLAGRDQVLQRFGDEEGVTLGQLEDSLCERLELLAGVEPPAHERGDVIRAQLVQGQHRHGGSLPAHRGELVSQCLDIVHGGDAGRVGADCGASRGENDDAEIADIAGQEPDQRARAAIEAMRVVEDEHVGRDGRDLLQCSQRMCVRVQDVFVGRRGLHRGGPRRQLLGRVAQRDRQPGSPAAIQLRELLDECAGARRGGRFDAPARHAEGRGLRRRAFEQRRLADTGTAFRVQQRAAAACRVGERSADRRQLAPPAHERWAHEARRWLRAVELGAPALQEIPGGFESVRGIAGQETSQQARPSFRNLCELALQIAGQDALDRRVRRVA
jgi:hypothetical protein